MLHEATVIKDTLFLRLQAYLVKNQPIASKYHVRKESKVLIELETVARYNPAALISLAGVHHPTKGGKKRRDEKGKVKKKEEGNEHSDVNEGTQRLRRTTRPR